MKKLKKIVRFSLKWVCLPICIVCVIASLYIAGYDLYLEGEYYGKTPKCLYTRQLTIDNSTDKYAIIQIDRDRTNSYNIIKDITCNDFDRMQSDKAIKNVYHVSGVSYAFLVILYAIGTLLLWCSFVILLVIIGMLFIVYVIDFTQKHIEQWIMNGKPSKRWLKWINEDESN